MAFWRLLLDLFVGNRREEEQTQIQNLTDRPWRKDFDWDIELEKSLLREIQQVQSEETLNVLTVGLVGEGKSSFINSILSIGKGRKCALAPVGDLVNKSVTLRLDKYIPDGPLKGIHLFDCMGMETLDENGLHVDDFSFLIKGHITERYKFNTRSPIDTDSTYYRLNPTIKDQMHCVVFVVSALNIHAGITPEYMQNIKSLLDKVRREYVPRILILTKVEQLCEEVEKDITKMFYSAKVQEAVKRASEVFGIEKASIHPVKNYQDEYSIEAQANIPLLLALKEIKHCAADREEHALRQERERIQ